MIPAGFPAGLLGVPMGHVKRSDEWIPILTATNTARYEYVDTYEVANA